MPFFEVSGLHPKQLVKKFTPQQRNIHVDLRVSTSGRTLLPITARGQAFLALSWLKQAVFAENQHAFQFWCGRHKVDSADASLARPKLAANLNTFQSEKVLANSTWSIELHEHLTHVTTALSAGFWGNPVLSNRGDPSPMCPVVQVHASSQNCLLPAEFLEVQS